MLAHRCDIWKELVRCLVADHSTIPGYGTDDDDDSLIMMSEELPLNILSVYNHYDDDDDEIDNNTNGLLMMFVALQGINSSPERRVFFHLGLSSVPTILHH